ncbi:NAD(P)/FAD-dependent oxidoreductase [Peptoniphilus sp. oral taxon 386]|uniref:NAD(P)/FAD-dependent oxidoreductase n=1 Tax=Peptoniphilus sp. oral taxon 386 TaxID=652713 RepID=UPI0001DA9AF9|nr:NAD(P)/FAD-dependent oxidoreductase [Peptoniphilus sp. oral taxon 386]EFI42067.1 flavoprotein family protein [Peptoniphilus sp. oral taxon 386 str. F0131]
MKNIAVIGGGPSGMMAAYFAAEGNNVTIFEKNEKLGKKLFITGKGRCNITNEKEISEFFEEVPRNEKFLYSAFYSFSNLDLIKLLNSYGLKMKSERGGRIFPSSDKSSDVIATYIKMLKDRNVDVRLNSEVKSVKKNLEYFIINDNFEEKFDSLIIATGGYSYRATGSTGDGYKFARDFDINVEKLYPALIPIELSDEFLDDLQGISLKNVSLSVKQNGKVISEEFGEMLFSHFGITGPIVLRTSSKINRMNKFKLYLDLKPALDFETLDSRILRDFEKFKNKEIKNALFELLPKKLVPVILKIADIDESMTVNQVTRADRNKLVHSIKEMPLTYKGLLDINAAIITSGGVSVKEIDPSTMESKKVKGLYFCGEVLDVEAFTGGFNMQIANSTGYIAGVNAGKK